MFAKLLKHEWKASAGILGILSLAALGAGVVGAFLMRYMTRASSEEASDVLLSISVIMLMFTFLAVFAYVISSVILLFHRFYKNKFTDEGYLTFTLPVRSWQIFLSSLLNIVVWMIIVSLVAVAAVFVMVFFGLADTGVFEQMDFSLIQEAFQGEVMETLPMQLLSSAVSFVSGIIVMMTCITLGAAIAKKHKLLAAIGLYYGLSMVQGVISTVITTAVLFNSTMNSATVLSANSMLDSIYIYEMAIQAVLAVGGFFLSTYLMGKKLNLP